MSCGAEVTRLNTYSTEKVTEVSEETPRRPRRGDLRVALGGEGLIQPGLDPNGEAPIRRTRARRTSAKACDSVAFRGAFPGEPGADGVNCRAGRRHESRGNAEDVA